MVSIVFEHNLDEVAKFFKDLGKAFDQNQFLKPHLEYGGATAVSMQRQDCPVQTGNLANSLQYTVSANTVENFTDVPYARDVEARTPYFFSNAITAYESMADTLADYIANIIGGGAKVAPKPPKLSAVKGKANTRVGTRRSPKGSRRMTINDL